MPFAYANVVGFHHSGGFSDHVITIPPDTVLSPNATVIVAVAIGGSGGAGPGPTSGTLVWASAAGGDTTLVTFAFGEAGGGDDPLGSLASAFGPTSGATYGPHLGGDLVVNCTASGSDVAGVVLVALADAPWSGIEARRTIFQTTTPISTTADLTAHFGQTSTFGFSFFVAGGSDGGIPHSNLSGTDWSQIASGSGSGTYGFGGDMYIYEGAISAAVPFSYHINGSNGTQVSAVDVAFSTTGTGRSRGFVIG